MHKRERERNIESGTAHYQVFMRFYGKYAEQQMSFSLSVSYYRQA